MCNTFQSPAGLPIASNGTCEDASIAKWYLGRQGDEVQRDWLRGGIVKRCR
jgi:hypothetical protein